MKTSTVLTKNVTITIRATTAAPPTASPAVTSIERPLLTVLWSSVVLRSCEFAFEPSVGHCICSAVEKLNKHKDYTVGVSRMVIS